MNVSMGIERQAESSGGWHGANPLALPRNLHHTQLYRLIFVFYWKFVGGFFSPCTTTQTRQSSAGCALILYTPPD